MSLCTNKAMINPSNDEAHISINKGISVLPGTSTSPDKVERPAPPAIDIEPPKPEAAPAKWERTDNIPAVAFGRHNPLPKPTKIKQPKKLMALDYPKKDKNTARLGKRPPRLKLVLTDSTLFGDTARFHGELPFAALAVEASHEANIKCLSFRNRKAFWRGDVGNPAKDVAVELGVFCEAEFTSWVDAPKGH